MTWSWSILNSGQSSEPVLDVLAGEDSFSMILPGQGMWSHLAQVLGHLHLIGELPVIALRVLVMSRPTPACHSVCLDCRSHTNVHVLFQRLG